MPRFLFQGLLTAGLLGGLSALISAWTPAARLCHRGRSSRCSIIPPVLVALLTSLTGERRPTRVLVLFSPGDVLDGANAWIFGADLGRTRRSPRSTCPASCTSRAALVATVVVIALDRPPLPADRRVTGPAPHAGPRRRPRLALVRQRRRAQRRLVRARPGRHRPARTQRRGQVDPAPPDGRPAQAVRGRGPRGGPDGLGPPRDVRADRPGPGARGDPRVPDRLRVRAPQRATPGPARPGRGGAAGHRDGRADRGRRPPDRHVLEGHAPARPSSPAPSSTTRRSCCSTSRSTAWTRASGCT